MAFAHSRGVASIGTMLHIKEHARMPDGRMLINSRGGRRFRIVRVVKERPVLICEVSWFDDDEDAMGEDDEYTLSELAGEMRTLFLNTLLLSNKTNGDDRDAEGLPAELDALDPTELSFWLMRVFAQHPGKQQLLLEYTSTRERLKRAQEVLQVRGAHASGALPKTCNAVRAALDARRLALIYAHRTRVCAGDAELPVRHVGAEVGAEGHWRAARGELTRDALRGSSRRKYTTHTRRTPCVSSRPAVCARKRQRREEGMPQPCRCVRTRMPHGRNGRPSTAVTTRRPSAR
jgi:Lon protease-like protein